MNVIRAGNTPVCFFTLCSVLLAVLAIVLIVNDWGFQPHQRLVLIAFVCFDMWLALSALVFLGSLGRCGRKAPKDEDIDA